MRTHRSDISMLGEYVRMLPYWILGNTLIALILVLFGMKGGIFQIWLFDQLIGLSIASTFFLSDHAMGFKKRWLTTLFSTAVGVGMGRLIFHWVGGPAIWRHVFQDWETGLRIAVLVLLIIVAFAFFFTSRAQVAYLEAARKEEELRRVHQENLALVAHLQMLQAQIEPHFLFNTLAHLHSLIESNPAQARNLLEHLNDFLRASLKHSRAGDSTLGDECRLLGTYLDIQALRMGHRLSWKLDLPEEWRALPMPPMLLQPLVENAVIHGIEPKLGTGRIEISASQVEGRLCLTVSDDGVGFSTGTLGQGVGLNNVRERLQALWGSGAELRIQAAGGGHEGVRAELWIPVTQGP